MDAMERLQKGRRDAGARVQGKDMAILLPAILLLAGCPRMPVDLAPLTLAVDCPDIAETVKVARNSPPRILQCVLARVRDQTDPDAASLALGLRAAFFLADQSEGELARRFASEGVRLGEEAVRKGADGAVHYYLAMCLGVVVQDTVVLALRNLPRIEAELKLAMQLAPGEEQGGPARVLGMVYLKAPAWPQGIGDPDRALELLSEAATTWPDHPANRIFYAHALWEVSGEDAKDEIRRQLSKAIEAIEAHAFGYAGPKWRSDAEALARQVGVQVP